MFTRKVFFSSRIFVFGILILSLLTSVSGISAQGQASAARSTAQALGNYAIVFVSRRIPTNGSVYYPQGGSMPGVQPYSRFQVASPGKLIIREANGTLRTLVDGSNPTAASLNLIDVNAPDVSYDGTKIVFAGLIQGNYYQGPVNAPGAWRIYMINVDGTGLKQITFSDRNINLAQFGNVASNFTRYDDTDPAWLPDGRIVFSSTRWPSFGMYGAALTSNLYVVNPNGTNLHRITAERNGAERPVVDPLTGRLVFSRWWRNFRLGTNNMATMVAPEGGYIMKDGICALSHQGAECQEAGGLTNLERNSWHLATINPDGTRLAQFAGRSMSTFIGEDINHAYGGAFAPDGTFYANFFPMMNGTEAAGFGGIRRYQRGANGYTPIIGITNRDENVLQFVSTSPTSYGVYVGNYAADPVVLPDGTLLISWAVDVKQDYGLYTINADGTNRILVYDNPGTTELRAKLILPRTVPPIIPDKVTKVASALPPLEQGPYDIDGTFTFKALNVYFNAPVDTNIISAIPVGSANTIRFFIDHQRSQQRGSFETLDWPILLTEVPINPDGSVTVASPANVPLFEQIRTKQPDYTIPITGRGTSPDEMPGAAHVAGMNYGRTGDVVTCVGCHAGHTLIPVPANPADAQWTNLAPGATVTYSSLHSSLPNGNGAVDRKVKLRIAYNNHYRYWLSREGQNPNAQWLQLTFPVPVTVRTVRLYNIPSTESSVKVLNTTVQLYSDAAGTNQVASATSGALSENGTNVPFSDVMARVVRIQFTSVNGTTAGLGEVEVIARGEGLNISIPRLTSVTRLNPDPTTASQADYSVIFTEAVSGVDATDFSVTSNEAGSATVASVTGSGANYTVKVNTGTCPGTIRLDVKDDDTIRSSSGGALNGSGFGDPFTGGELYTVQKTYNTEVFVGTGRQGCYTLNQQGTASASFPGVIGGPARVVIGDASPIFTTQVVTSGGSYNELAGYPINQFSNEYWFPFYDHGYPNVSGNKMRTWLAIGNPSTSQVANVSVYVGGVLQGTNALNPGAQWTPRWIGLVGGPVQVVSDLNIFASERVFTIPNGSFNEVMGYPSNQFTTEYWFPWYDTVNMDSYILVGNTSSTDAATVDIYIKDAKMGTYNIAPNAALKQRYNNQVNGPVRVVSTNGVNIVTSQYTISGVENSFNEVMGYPATQFTTEYWFPNYDHGYPNVPGNNMRTWLAIGNPSATETANVQVYIAGELKETSAVAPGGQWTPRWIGLVAGPVQVISDIPIFASQRVFTAPTNAFNEFMGIPANQMTNEYWFPWYDSVNMNNKVFISKP